MPNIKSAAKRLRQSIVRRQRNRTIKRAVKTQCRKVEDALEEGNADQVRAEFSLAAKKLDQAAAKGAIHRNAAARLKSRLAAKMKATLPKPVKL
jgi:small subunit ribosomal protein S20